jgi:hypothetical protein
VSANDFASLKRRAMAKPEGPEALRLSWLQARAIGSPRKRLLELIEVCRNRDFAIPEIDAYVAEELASARERLSKARQEGSVASRTLRTLEQTIEAAEASEHTRRRDSRMDPTLERALDIAGDLAAKAEKQPA